MQRAYEAYREEGRAPASAKAERARSKAQAGRQSRSNRAIIYLRVSDFSQEKYGKNLTGQLDEVRAYCQRKGYAFDEDHDVYRDIISGARNDRQGYYQLLARIERADAGVIVAYEVSRFGRNGTDNAWLLVKAKENGFSLETVTGGRDFTADPESEFQFDILSAVAKYERNAIMWRMLRGKKTGHGRGHWVAGAPPLGYTPVGPRGAKVLRANEDAPLAREIFERFAAGESMKGIAKRFVTEGRRSVASAKHQSRWSCAGIGTILKCPMYTGLVQYQGDVAKGLHEALIPQDLWDRVAARRAELQARYGITKRRREAREEAA